MFRVNEVLQYDKEWYRVLAILKDEIVWIQLDNEKAFPCIESTEALSQAILDEALIRIDDPNSDIAFLRVEEGATSQVERDHNFRLIEPIVTNSQFFHPKVRGPLIEQIVAEGRSTKQTLLRLIRRYWQRGQTANALIPDYRNSGARGKKREAKNKKLGRPRKYTPGVGAKIDVHIEKLFRIAIDRYILTKKQHTFGYAHRKFKSLYVNLNPGIAESEIPSYSQMMHFYNREYSITDGIKKRLSNIDYNKDVRPLISTANTQVLGPGSRYEIDATIADIYLLSDSERQNIIGRPVIYLVVDVFSRMIAGFYVGLENPSYVAAMQAITMAMVDKVEYCKTFGIEILGEEWPTVGIPDAILADRGELFGHQIEALETVFSVRIENTPPYRGDAKGIVERKFKTLQAEFKPFAPGVVLGTNIKKRGGKDYRLDATFTLHKFTEIIIESIMYHNCDKLLSKYDRDIDIPPDLEMTPLSLWNWGISNRTGRLRVVSEDALKVSLMPDALATVSEKGVQLFGVYYTSSEILQQGWLHRSKVVKRPGKVKVRYDPRNAEIIYLIPEANSIEYWICSLTPRSREFAGCSFYDVWQLKEEQKKTLAKSKLNSEKKRRELENYIDGVIKDAKSGTDTRKGESKKSRIGSIRENRTNSLKNERENASYVKPKKRKGDPAPVIPISKDDDASYQYPNFINRNSDKED